jgi:putative cell wall-binding protein
VTSAEVSERSFTGPQGTAFVASGFDFPDALAGGAVAARQVAPLMLTKPGAVSAAVSSELTRLAPGKIYVLGGPGAVSSAAMAQLTVIAPTVRIGGANRYETAANASKVGFPTASTVYVASGMDFADALSGGPGAAKQDAPMLLTLPSTLPEATHAELVRLKPTTVKVMGGTGAVPDLIVEQIRSAVPGVSITRHGGANRYETAAALARAVWPVGAPTVFFASGFDFPDGLSGTPAAAVNDAPLLLSTKSCMPPATVAADKALKPSLRVFIGGPSVLSTSTTACGTPPPTTPTPTGSALTALNALLVKGRAAKTGYERDQFGSAWSDDVSVQGGHNGCDTRNDVLRRDLTSEVLKADSGGCTVLSGNLKDPYSGKTINFVRGTTTSIAVQIDHIVSLSNAWQTGAQPLSAAQRKDFANDPLNLWAVDGPLNAQKGDGDAATWLPPATAIRCLYVARQVAVKKTYNMWVTAPEKDAITAVLSACPGQQLPTAATWATPPR